VTPPSEDQSGPSQPTLGVAGSNPAVVDDNTAAQARPGPIGFSQSTTVDEDDDPAAIARELEQLRNWARLERDR
jgi:hypothetical protein